MPTRRSFNNAEGYCSVGVWLMKDGMFVKSPCLRTKLTRLKTAHKSKSILKINAQWVEAVRPNGFGTRRLEKVGPKKKA